jgi:chemotaxis-related protein WspD
VTELLEVASEVDPCWSRIGVKGDQSCPSLDTFVHCHNCPVFAEAAQLFLDRPLPEGYLIELSTSFAQAKEARIVRKSLSVVVCEVEDQLLAIESKAVIEVTEPRPVHRIGRRSGRVFQGIVNIHGQLELCASLKGLLQIGIVPSIAASASRQPRMVLVELAGQRWVFPVDAVLGVQRFDEAEAFRVPATAQHDHSSLIAKVLSWNERSVGLLDLQKVVSALDKNLR